MRLGAIAAFTAIMAYFVVFAPGFTSTFNLINVVEQSAILGVLAYGMTSVIIGGGSDVTEGGIDLSIAANMGLCAAVYATLLSMGYGDFLSVLAAIAVGMVVGGLNALAVVGLGILPLLATLAVLNVAAGMELTLTQNTVVGASSPLLGFLVSGAFLGISALAWALFLLRIARTTASFSSRRSAKCSGELRSTSALCLRALLVCCTTLWKIGFEVSVNSSSWNAM